MIWSCLPFIRSRQNHLARHSEGGRRHGRQKKRWEDSIREWTGLEFAKREWTGLEFAKSQRAVGNREEWKKLVEKSSVVPQQPSQLRDR